MYVHGHSVSYSYIYYVMFVWSGLMGGFLSILFLKIPLWLVCYAHGLYAHKYVYVCTTSLIQRSETRPHNTKASDAIYV